MAFYGTLFGTVKQEGRHLMAGILLANGDLTPPEAVRAIRPGNPAAQSGRLKATPLTAGRPE